MHKLGNHCLSILPIDSGENLWYTKISANSDRKERARSAKKEIR